MSFNATNGHDFGRAILEALGLPKGGCNRIVIVADTEGAAMVYLRGYLNLSAVPGIVRAVKDVQVSPDGDVTVEPFIASEARS